MHTYVIGIDGGGSKTRMVLGDTHGNILEDIVTLGSNYQHIGRKAAARNLGSGIKRLIKNAGVGEREVAHIFMGLSGLDLPEDMACYTGICKDICAGIPFTVVNDIWLVLRGENPPRPCSVVICGTGSNAATVTSEGGHYILRQLGYELGSYGGGHDMAREAFHRAFRSEESTGAKTELEHRLPALYGMTTLADCISLFYPRPQLSVSELSRAAKIVFELADTGDAVCMDILYSHGQRLAQNLIGTAARASVLENELSVVLGGSLLSLPGSELSKGFVQTVCASIPHARFISSSRPPVMGAYMYALDNVGVVQSPELLDNIDRHLKNLVLELP